MTVSIFFIKLNRYYCKIKSLVWGNARRNTVGHEFQHLLKADMLRPKAGVGRIWKLVLLEKYCSSKYSSWEGCWRAFNSSNFQMKKLTPNMIIEMENFASGPSPKFTTHLTWVEHSSFLHQYFSRTLQKYRDVIS